MTLRPVLGIAGAALVGLSACNAADSAAPAAVATNTATASATNTATSRSTADASPGQLLITLTGETLGRNSAGDANSVACELKPTATNNSAVEIKSLHVEFTVRNASNNTLIDAAHGLTMPMRIATGATVPAWGSLYIDNHRCEALALTLNPMLPGACRTVSKAPCPVVAVAATGVARAE